MTAMPVYGADIPLTLIDPAPEPEPRKGRRDDEGARRAALAAIAAEWRQDPGALAAFEDDHSDMFRHYHGPRY